MIKEACSFIVEGTTIQGVFHRPSKQVDDRIPLVVMGNGYATEWQFGTEKIINALTAAGIATFNFDYRHFGQSAGEPRQLLDIPGQQNDFQAAIEQGRRQSWVDTQRIVVWGSSLGGGHAISMAAKNTDICAMVAQVPHCCSRAAFKTVSLANVFTGMSRAIVDTITSVLGRPPLRIPVLAEPDSYGVLNHPGWMRDYRVIINDSPTWENTIPARSLLKGGDYRPIQVADQIQCPTLLVAAREDAGVPLSSVEETAARINQVEMKVIEGDHFGVYFGQYIDEVVDAELNFIKRHVFA